MHFDWNYNLTLHFGQIGVFRDSSCSLISCYSDRADDHNESQMTRGHQNQPELANLVYDRTPFFTPVDALVTLPEFIRLLARPAL